MTRIQAKLAVGCLAIIAFCLVAMPVLLNAAEPPYDLVLRNVFDPTRVRDTATYEKPHQYAEGFAYVLVNGQIVYENGSMTTTRPGKVLYGPGKNAATQ
jgi:hypothetical protein